MRFVSVTALCFLTAAIPAQDFVNYETSQVHPIEIAGDGGHLFVTNTPDDRVAIFSLGDPRRPVLIREVFVGLRPVTVRQRNSGIGIEEHRRCRIPRCGMLDLASLRNGFRNGSLRNLMRQLRSIRARRLW